jgi:pyruvate kinase
VVCAYWLRSACPTYLKVALSLWWGVTPLRSELEGTMDEKIAWVDAYVRGEGLAAPGEQIVIMGGMRRGGAARTNFVKLHRVGESGV